MATDRTRIEEQIRAAQSPNLALHRALSRLRSTVHVMNTGAHPDDEQSGLLAWFRFGLGMRTSIACSTRGEGGQNILGPERGGALAVLRTREMEEAARHIDADVIWLGHGPDDPVHDFGFSKDGDQTFARWGKERVVERMVRAYRQERPDIVIPTFLDVPGQHGHHRAMTRAAWEAIALAASPEAFPEHFAEGLMPWAVAKFYLPAWSGGGSTYDDETPPPPATSIVNVDGVDAATGVAYDHIGEWSRLMHASQGMGEWLDNPQTEWPLHLSTGVAERSILDGLPIRLADLTTEPDLAALLSRADAATDRAIAAFPDRPRIIAALIDAALAVTQARAKAPVEFLKRHGHRLTRKLREIDAALVEAAGLVPTVTPSRTTIPQGGAVMLEISGQVEACNCRLCLPAGITAQPTEAAAFRLTAAADAPLSPLFLPGWSVLGGNGVVSVEFSMPFEGYEAHCLVDLARPLTVQPACSVKLVPDAIIAPLDGPQGPWTAVLDIEGNPSNLALVAPKGWSVEVAGADRTAILHTDAPRRAGLTVFPVEVDAKEAFRVDAISYPHIGTTIWREPARLRVLLLDLALPTRRRIGYVGGGADNVGLWLRRMGFDTVELMEADLAGDLGSFDSIVIGVVAFGARPALAGQAAALHRYVDAGGNLVTLYHRPDQWDAVKTPPRRLRIGSPSLRWRVTDPAAPVSVIAHNHPLLNRPNRIGADDWDGWNKERGLYFAADWDPAYQPLLAMSDAGEAPLNGAIVTAEIGKGRHSHVALVLHHQMERLTPGAFRLFANLLDGRIA